MNDKELLKFIAKELHMLDRDDAMPHEVNICEALRKSGYLKIEMIEDDDGRIVAEEYRCTK